MKIFALSDPHLSAVSNKPMDVFGDNWSGHTGKIRERWLDTVAEEDVVLIGGDISWALKLDEARRDLLFLGELPGIKILLRGNHDYWWSGLKKVREAAGEGFYIIQNNSVVLGGVGISGSRLWNYPFIRWPIAGSEKTETDAAVYEMTKNNAGNGSGKHGDIDDDKVCKSEIGRLQNSLATIPQNVDLKICLTHFPPISAKPETNELTRIISNYNIDYTVYGHLHALDRLHPYEGADCELDGVRYILASCDWLDFVPKLIVEV